MKRIVISILLLAAMMAGMMSVGAAAAEITIQVTASKTEVQVGDQVDFTVLATGNGVVAMQFDLRFPEGLRYVSKSGKTPAKLAQKLGVAAADWTEQSKMFTFYNDKGINFAAGTKILQFSCIAEKAGEWEVELYELLPFNDDFEEFTPKLQVQKVRVIKKEEQVPPTVPKETEPVVPKPTEPSVTPTVPKETEPVAPSPTKPAVTPTVPETTVPTATEPAVTNPTKPTAPATVPEETLPAMSPEGEASASVTNKPIVTTSPETPEETTPEALDPDQQKNEAMTAPTDPLEEIITIGASQDVQVKEENTSNTAAWVWIVAAVAVVVIGVVVFFVVKKKYMQKF